MLVQLREILTRLLAEERSSRKRESLRQALELLDSAMKMPPEESKIKQILISVFSRIADTIYDGAVEDIFNLFN
ncbi:MAG: hypothetical protein RL757_1833 [Bacteroidota bacterium]